MSEPLPLRGRISLTGGNFVTLLAALGVLLLGVAAIVSWQLSRELLFQQGAGLPLLEYRFALAFVLAGVGMALGALGYRRLTLALALAVAATALSVLLPVIDHLDRHLDVWLMPYGWQQMLATPPQMPAEAAVCWILVSLALGLMPPRPAVGQRSLLLMLLGTLIFGFGLAGFVANMIVPPGSSSWSHLPRIPAHAGVGFIALALGFIDFGYRQRQRGPLPIRDLRNAIIIYTTFGMLLMIVLTAMLAILPLYDRLCQAQHDSLLHAVGGRATQVEQYLGRIRTIAQQITSRRRARELLEAYDDGKLSQADGVSELGPTLEDALHSSPEIVGITRLDEHGQPLVSVGTTIPQGIWPSNATQLLEPGVGDPVLWEGGARLVISAPILTQEQRRLGTDLLLVAFPELADILAAPEQGMTSYLLLHADAPGQADTFALTGTGDQIAASELPPSCRMRLYTEAHGTPALLSRAADDHGLLYAFASVRGTSWLLVSRLPANQLYYPVRRQLLIVLVVVTLFAFVAAVGIFVLLRPLTGGIVIQTDLLEHKIQEATVALAESEERFQLAMRGTDAGIWDWDLRSDQVYYSPRWKSILGYAEDEIRDHFSEWEERLHPDDRAHAQGTLQRFLAGETPSYELEHRLRHKDGSYRWILARAMVLRDATRHPYRMVGSHLDVTDRKRAEMQLQETAEALRRSNRDLEQFASIASHDLQEPLRMLSAYLDAISRQYRDRLPSPAHALIDLSTQTGKRMQQLINDLLTYSRVTTRPLELYPVDCEEVVAEVLRNLKLTLEEQAATVVSADLPVVRGDRTQLVQLFQNLIGNGIKFHGDTPPRVQVTAEQSDGRWRFAVCDNGIGIEAQYAETVFEIFQRLHPSEAYPGTGIGLAVCKRIIDRHEGQIWFESTLGQGTTFFFTLPALEARAAVA